MSHVLVTGGTGFIGSFLVEHLLGGGHQVRVPKRGQNYRALSSRRAEVEWMEGDLREPAFCEQLVEGVDRVFHFASARRNVAFHYDHAGDVAMDNARMSFALIDAVKKKRIPVAFCSSANVPPSLDLVELSKQKAVDGYVLGKGIAESAWIASAAQHDFPLLILRPVGVYGPRDTFSLEGNVIPSLMVKARDSKDELVVWGSGKQERAFLYVEDLIAALFALLDAGATGIQYISSGEILQISALAEMIRNLVHPDLPIRFDTGKPEGRPIAEMAPFHPALQKVLWTSLEEGLKKTMEWWKSEKI